MNDFRRNFLWVVFAMSLVLLWDAWNKHNGQPTLLGAPIATETASAPGGVPASGAVAPAAAGTPADRKSTRLNSSHSQQSRMPSSA